MPCLKPSRYSHILGYRFWGDSMRRRSLCRKVNPQLFSLLISQLLGTIMSKTRIFIIFILVFLISLTMVNALDRYIAHHVITRDAQVISTKFKMYLHESAKQLERLTLVDASVLCSDALHAQLKRATFEASFIRWIGLKRAGKVVCQSSDIPYKMSNLTTHKIQSGLSLGVLNHNAEQGHELFLIRHLDGVDYVASITPMHPRYFVPVSCEHCLEYTVSIDSSPYLKFGFDQFNGDAAVEYVIKDGTDLYQATYALTGNADFLAQYTNLSWLIGVSLSLLMGLLVAGISWHWFTARNSMSAQIKRGIKNYEFVPYYQPILDGQTQALVGCEVLMRWQQGEGSVVPPNQFIPYAEASGDIIAMTRSMLERMVADIEEYGQDNKPLFYSVNIVPAHLDDDQLLNQLESIVKSGRLGGHQLSLEITERLPILDMARARAMLDRIYALGIALKLDDAGTGYGCFSYVQHLGISTLKVDKMFVDTIGQEMNFNAKTLDAIISFAHKSNLEMIAEGVETQEQLDYLCSQGVQLIQGYVFSKPLTASAFFKYNRL